MLFFWFSKNCELIRDSSLWRSNFIPLVHDSIIIIGSRSVTYTFGSRFTYKRWVRVLSKIWILAFLGKYSNIDCWVSKRVNWGSHHILILFVRSQCVSIEVRITLLIHISIYSWSLIFLNHYMIIYKWILLSWKILSLKFMFKNLKYAFLLFRGIKSNHQLYP